MRGGEDLISEETIDYIRGLFDERFDYHIPVGTIVEDSLEDPYRSQFLVEKFGRIKYLFSPGTMPQDEGKEEQSPYARLLLSLPAPAVRHTVDPTELPIIMDARYYEYELHGPGYQWGSQVRVQRHSWTSTFAAINPGFREWHHAELNAVHSRLAQLAIKRLLTPDDVFLPENDLLFDNLNPIC